MYKKQGRVLQNDGPNLTLKTKLNNILNQSINYERILTFFLSMILEEHYIKSYSVSVTFYSVPCTHTIVQVLSRPVR